MKTLEQIKDQYFSETLDGKDPYVSLDGRDLHRLAKFIPKDQLKDFGIELTDSNAEHEAISFTRDNILIQLEKDVEFGFVKALNRRGLSASAMFDVVRMWNWILEEGLENWDEDTNYAQYGLPLFKATANKYGFRDEIPDKQGNEYEFSADYGYESCWVSEDE